MKHYLILAISLLLSAVASASEVTIPNEFVAGTPAVADDVNENFDAVKTAVDDNHARITELESQVVESGAVSVSAYAFNDNGVGCNFGRHPSHVFLNEEQIDCTAVAPVSLPHGAIITGVSCLLYDDETDPQISPISLRRSNLTTGDDEAIFARMDPTTTSVSPAVYSMTDSGVTGGNLVDNTAYVYFLAAVFDTVDAVALNSVRLYNCKVSYTLGN